MSNNLILMYVSCFTYKNLWESFIKLKKKYIGDSIKMYLCTDIINDYKLSDPHIEILNFNKKSNFNINGNLFDRFLYYLDYIDTEYVLYFCDDMYIMDNVDLKKINEFLEIMKNNDDVKIIKLSLHSYPFNYGTSVTYNNNLFIKASNEKDEYIFNLQPILIKKTFFKNLLNFCKENNTLRHQNGGLEIFGTIFFRKNPNYTCLRVTEDIIKVPDAGGIVRSGIMSNEIKKMLKEKENIEITTYSNNLIFEMTKDEYDLFGDFNKKYFLENNININ